MNELHSYRCSFCKTVATTTIKFNPKCALCLRVMAFLYSVPVSAEEWQARNLNPPVFRSPHEIAETRTATRKCDTCRAWVDRAALIDLSGVGKFCSSVCADAGAADHERFMLRIQKLRQDMPWLYPAQQEKVS